MRYYIGAKKCPGCGISDKVKSRFSAEGLCYDCIKLLALGKSVK